MPHSMSFKGQKNKWFSVLIFTYLPFYVVYKYLKGDLPSLKELEEKNNRY